MLRKLLAELGFHEVDDRFKCVRVCRASLGAQNEKFWLLDGEREELGVVRFFCRLLFLTQACFCKFDKDKVFSLDRN